MKKKKKFIHLAIIVTIVLCIPMIGYAQEQINTYNWKQEDVRKLELNDTNTAPYIDKNELLEISDDYYIWDSWPLQDRSGYPAVVKGYKIMFALSAPKDVLPSKRHDVAKIHYFYSKDGKNWEAGGPVFKGGDALGSRQWAGSSIVHKDGKLQIFYTATGQKNEEQLSYDQKIATATADILITNKHVSFDKWSGHQIILEPDGTYYQTGEQLGQEEPSYAFRDPYFFQDPKTGEAYLLFEANTAGHIKNRNTMYGDTGSEEYRDSKAYNGSIGIARARDVEFRSFEILPPLVEANFVNDELERPSVIVKGNHYYLFAKTHHNKFAPGLVAPEGLYGFISKNLLGGYKPLNESGLVIANPVDNPYQAYSWMVMPNGTVTSFVHYVTVGDKDIDEIGEQSPEYQKEHFGGMLAPSLKLSIADDETRVLHEKKQGVVK